MEITIGKFTLETLTSGMYERPKDIYREYIQNAVDSIDNAVSEKLIRRDKARVDVIINKSGREIKITDNGTGINSTNAVSYLLDIGHSPKRFTDARGFRGIGRLAGLAYCDTLAFETTAVGEDKRTIIEFNARLLCERMLNEGCDVDLLSLITDVVTVKTEREVRTAHYFSVKMSGVEDTDGILDIGKVRSYLEQVAPVDFDKTFGWSKIIQSKLRAFDFAQSSYNIFVGDNNSQNLISKPYRDSFVSDRLRKLNDNISEIEIKEFIYNGSTIAHLWYAKSSFYGTLQDEAIKGVRVRKGNILIGDKTTLNHVFKDERFNGWLFGELHVISNNLIPNARRDEIEKNATYAELVSQLKEWADEISGEIRKTSNQRSSDKKAQRIIEFVQNEMTSAIESVTTIVLPEVVLTSQPEVDEVNHTELVTALDLLVGTQQSNTKYKALNLQSNITAEQKQVLERVFDIICDNNQQTDELITKIIREFTPKSLITS